MRLNGRVTVILGAIVGLLVIAATDRILPASTPYQAQMRVWLAARAAGLVAYLALTLVVALGLILSHPVNQSTWKLSKRLFPWHENLFVFVVAFVIAHVVGIVLDPYADVGLVGSLVPGASTFRPLPVALGSLALYALLITGLTARYMKLLPMGWWLRIHRICLVVFVLAWAHGILAGTDSDALRAMYVVSGAVIVWAAAYRYWVGKKRRPTFATSLPGTPGTRPVAVEPAPTLSPRAQPTLGEDAGS